MESTLPITMQELADQLNCSERTIRTDLDIIDDWLRQNNVPSSTRKPRVGVYLALDEEHRNTIYQLMEDLHPKKYEFSRSERAQFIALQLLFNNRKYTVDYFTDIFYVSRNTILKDLKRVESMLKPYRIDLIRRPYHGIFIEGTEINIRQAVGAIIHELNPILMPSWSGMKAATHQVAVQKLLSDLRLDEIRQIIDPILRFANLNLSDQSRQGLYTHIALAIKRSNFSDYDFLSKRQAKYLMSKHEYEVARFIFERLEMYYDIRIPEKEVLFITLYLIGNQSAPSLTSKNQLQQEDRLVKVIKHMNLIMQNKLMTRFRDPDNLVNGLLLHLKPAIYRAKYGIYIENELLEDFKTDYANLFESAKHAVRYAEEEYDIRFSEEEIAYIAMHYGSALVGGSVETSLETKVMVVCTSGLGTANMLNARLKELFSNIHIVETLSLQMLKEKKSLEAELIVSTVPISGLKTPVLVVNPLIPQEDFERLSLYLSPRRLKKMSPYQLYEAIWPIVQKHCWINDHKSLTKDLINRLQRVLDGHRHHMPLLSINTLDQLLDQDTIQLNVEADDWVEAIEVAVRPLQTKKWVTSNYAEKITIILRERGPYMAVAPGVLLAHANADATVEVKRVCMAFTRLKDGVNFGHRKNDPIRMIFVFATDDGESHKTALDQLLRLLMDEENREQLLRLNDVWEVMKVIDRFVNQRGG